MSEQEPTGYPLFLRLRDKKVLVVGGGAVAREKAEALLAVGAKVVVVAPEIGQELAQKVDAIARRGVLESDLDGAWLVIAAAPPEVNRRVKAAADARRIFVIAVDDVDHCTAIGAAQLHRGGLTVAISSHGRAPALVALLRRAIEAVIPQDVDAWMGVAEEARRAWKSAGVPFARRRPLLLDALNAMYAEAGLQG